MRTWAGVVVGAALALATHQAGAQIPTYITTWGNVGNGPGQFAYFTGIAVGPDGNVYVADTGNCRIQVFTSSGIYLRQWGSVGPGNGQLENPTGIALDAAGNVFVVDSGNNRVQVFGTDGTYRRQWGGVFGPYGVALGTSGDIFITGRTSSSENQVQRFTVGGAWIGGWGPCCEGDGRFYGAKGVAVDGAGNVYVADSNGNRVEKFTSDGTFLGKFCCTGTGPGLDNPAGVAVDADGTVYVASTRGDTVWLFTSAGEYVGLLEPSGYRPEGVATGSVGVVYVAVSGDNRVLKFGAAPTAAKRMSWGRLKASYRAK